MYVFQIKCIIFHISVSNIQYVYSRNNRRFRTEVVYLVLDFFAIFKKLQNEIYVFKIKCIIYLYLGAQIYIRSHIYTYIYLYQQSTSLHELQYVSAIFLKIRHVQSQKVRVFA